MSSKYFSWIYPPTTTPTPQVREVQMIKSSTVDTVGSGGDDHVSGLTYFTVIYTAQDGGYDGITVYETTPVYANPDTQGDCDASAAALRDALLALTPVEQVTVMGHKTGADQACEWRITFDGQSGNIDQVKVRVGPNGAPGLSGVSGDDTIVASTLTDGTVDAIKYELEKLTTVGTVSVRAANYSQTEGAYPNVNQGWVGACVWEVTFETNAGRPSTNGQLEQMQVAVVLSDGTVGPFDFEAKQPTTLDTVKICDPATAAGYACRPGTSTHLGGQWTAQVRVRVRWPCAESRGRAAAASQTRRGSD